MVISACMTGNVAAQGIVDVHCHNILPYYLEVLEEHDAAMDEGFPLPAWDAGAHLKFMDEAGIGCSILTMPAPQPYFNDTEECQRTIRRYNEYCAKLKAIIPAGSGSAPHCLCLMWTPPSAKQFMPSTPWARTA